MQNCLLIFFEKSRCLYFGEDLKGKQMQADLSSDKSPNFQNGPTYAVLGHLGWRYWNKLCMTLLHSSWTALTLCYIKSIWKWIVCRRQFRPWSVLNSSFLDKAPMQWQLVKWLASKFPGQKCSYLCWYTCNWQSHMWQSLKRDLPACTCRTKRWTASADTATVNENNQIWAGDGWSAADSQDSSCKAVSPWQCFKGESLQKRSPLIRAW